MNNKKIVLPLVAVIVLLVAGVVYLGYSLSQEKQVNKDMQELAVLEKQEMENEYQQFADQYSEMKTRINNDSIVAQLNREQQRTQQLLEELRKTKADDAAEITRLKKELATVRAVLRSYVLQIDSLNTLNHKLTADAAAARKEAASSRAENAELKGQVESLSGQVAAGSVIKSRGLSVAAYNSSDKVTDRSSRVVRLLASLSLVENDLAPKGPVRVYLRVKDPEGILLTNSVQTSFNYNGQTLIASASREVDYQGKEVDLSIYLNDIPSYQAGIYTIEAYTTQAFLGKTELLLR